MVPASKLPTVTDAVIIHFRRCPRESASSPSRLSLTRHLACSHTSRFCTTLVHAPAVWTTPSEAYVEYLFPLAVPFFVDIRTGDVMTYHRLASLPRVRIRLAPPPSPRLSALCDSMSASAAADETNKVATNSKALARSTVAKN